MKRRLVKQGNGALTLTLPYQWVSKNSLEKGDYIDLLESGKDLLISTDLRKTDKSYEITLSKETPFFKRYLRSCYILGYDSISLTSNHGLPISMIKKALNTLIGYEVIEQSKKKCVIAIVASPYDDNFDSVLRRMFFMIESMMSDIEDSLTSKNISGLKEIAAMEESINTFSDFCLRILNKNGYNDFRKTPYLYQIIIGLEQLGDALRDFTLSVKTPSKKLIVLISELKNYFTSLQKLFYKYDMKKIKKIKEQRVNLYSQLRLAAPTYPVQMLDLYLILSILHQVEIALDPMNN